MSWSNQHTNRMNFFNFPARTHQLSYSGDSTSQAKDIKKRSFVYSPKEQSTSKLVPRPYSQLKQSTWSIYIASWDSSKQEINLMFFWQQKNLSNINYEALFARKRETGPWQIHHGRTQTKTVLWRNILLPATHHDLCKVT